MHIWFTTGGVPETSDLDAASRMIDAVDDAVRANDEDRFVRMAT